jgi:hypothetical protein
MLGCAKDPGGSPDGETAEPPSLALDPTDSRVAPLAWRLHGTLASESDVGVHVQQANDEWVQGPFHGAAIDTWLYRWRAGGVHDVDVTATDAGGVVTEWSFTVEAPPLPDDFPVPVVVVSDPARMEPGFTAIAPSPAGSDGASYLLAVDQTGVVVWWYATGGSIHAVTKIGDKLRIMRNKDGVYEVDLRGDTLREWHPLDASPNGVTVPTSRLHHDLIELPDGQFLTLSIEGRDLQSFPLNESAPDERGPAFVAGDVVVEFDPETGAIAHEWPLLDRLDADRIGYDVITGDYWDEFFEETTRDWSHANALAYDPATNRIWVSLRHQDAIVSLDRTTGEIDRILGTPDEWDPAFAPKLLSLTSGAWPFHQHGHQLLPDGSLLMFDNGNYEAVPPGNPVATPQSRAVQYQVDAAAGTAREIWRYEDPRWLFSGSLGNAEWLPITDHVLIDYGNLRAQDGNPGVRVIEVTHTEQPEIVFEIAFYPAVPEGDVTAYRAWRWPEL